MKFFIINIVAILAFVNPCYSQKLKTELIKITFVDSYIETLFSIPCSHFENAFSKNEYKIRFIKNKDNLKSFKKTFGEFITTNFNGIDVRGVIKYTSNTRSLKYCFDFFGKFTDGISYYKNLNLAKLLHRIYPKIKFNLKSSLYNP